MKVVRVALIDNAVTPVMLVRWCELTFGRAYSVVSVPGRTVASQATDRWQIGSWGFAWGFATFIFRHDADEMLFRLRWGGETFVE